VVKNKLIAMVKKITYTLKKQMLFLLFVMAFCGVYGQQSSPKVYVTAAVSNDSLVHIELDDIDVYPRKGQKMNKRRYSRLVSKLRKVYPFAVDAAKELEKYNEKFEHAQSDSERRKYVRMVEKELFAKHEDELRRFTLSEGRYLVLLIDRQTGNSSYSIIKEVKGGVPAVFWQGIAKIFRNDLKEEYDPFYKHFVIEQIVLMIEQEYREEQNQTQRINKE
jgi:hypothetical protein